MHYALRPSCIATGTFPNGEKEGVWACAAATEQPVASEPLLQDMQTPSNGLTGHACNFARTRTYTAATWSVVQASYDM